MLLTLVQCVGEAKCINHIYVSLLELLFYKDFYIVHIIAFNVIKQYIDRLK